MDLAALGITPEELREQIIERAASKLVDADEEEYNESIYDRVNKRHTDMLRDAIDKAIAKLSNETLIPMVREKIETLVMRETNSYGEPKGDPVPFVQYLVGRAESYLREKVNYEGRDKSDAGYGTFNGTQTRITWLVHKHLHDVIQSEVSKIVSGVHTAFGQALQDTVKIKLQEIANGLKISVQTGR